MAGRSPARSSCFEQRAGRRRQRSRGPIERADAERVADARRGWRAAATAKRSRRSRRRARLVPHALDARHQPGRAAQERRARRRSRARGGEVGPRRSGRPVASSSRRRRGAARVARRDRRELAAEDHVVAAARVVHERRRRRSASRAARSRRIDITGVMPLPPLSRSSRAGAVRRAGRSRRRPRRGRARRRRAAWSCSQLDTRPPATRLTVIATQRVGRALTRSSSSGGRGRRRSRPRRSCTGRRDGRCQRAAGAQHEGLDVARLVDDLDDAGADLGRATSGGSSSARQKSAGDRGTATGRRPSRRS